MNSTLMKAILAMDSYNRGYGQGIDGLSGEKGTKIGNATVYQQSDTAENDPGVQAGFYAIAYDYNGQKVISYRGTDDLIGTDSDIGNGWVLGSGNVQAPQGKMAVQFYQDVVKASYGNSNAANLLTANIGHSLGGGLVH